MSDSEIPGELASMLLGSFMGGNLTEAELRNSTKYYMNLFNMDSSIGDQDIDVEMFAENLKELFEVCKRSQKLKDRIPAITESLREAVLGLCEI